MKNKLKIYISKVVIELVNQEIIELRKERAQNEAVIDNLHNKLKEFLTEEQIVELYKIDNEKIDKIEFVY